MVKFIFLEGVIVAGEKLPSIEVNCIYNAKLEPIDFTNDIGVPDFPDEEEQQDDLPLYVSLDTHSI